MTNTSNNKTDSSTSKIPVTTTTLPKQMVILNISRKEARRVGWRLLKLSFLTIKGRITVLVDQSK